MNPSLTCAVAMICGVLDMLRCRGLIGIAKSCIDAGRRLGIALRSIRFKCKGLLRHPCHDGLRLLYPCCIGALHWLTGNRTVHYSTSRIVQHRLCCT